MDGIEVVATVGGPKRVLAAGVWLGFSRTSQVAGIDGVGSVFDEVSEPVVAPEFFVGREVRHIERCGFRILSWT